MYVDGKKGFLFVLLHLKFEIHVTCNMESSDERLVIVHVEARIKFLHLFQKVNNQFKKYYRKYTSAMQYRGTCTCNNCTCMYMYII